MKLTRIAQHEHTVTLAWLLVILVLSWMYVLSGAGTMQDMGGMTMPMSTWPWSAGHGLLMFAMWLSMMTAMMLPSATPMILLYGTVARRGGLGSWSAPACFAAGYLAVWAGFSFVALLAQFLLEWTGFLSPMMESATATLSGALFIAAGVYQFTPLKRSCLRQCRAPIEFLTSHWRPGKAGAFRMGARHGLYCVGCCWGLMLLLFVGGLMNLLWIVGMTIMIMVEKMVPGGRHFSHAVGILLVLAGAGLLLDTMY